MADSSEEAFLLNEITPDQYSNDPAQPPSDLDSSAGPTDSLSNFSSPPELTEPTDVPIVYNAKSSLESRPHQEIHNIQKLIEVQQRTQAIVSALASTSSPISRSPSIANKRFNSRSTQRQELYGYR